MPTENRSSNTEMVSVPREPCGEMLNAARNAPIPLVHLDSMSARQDLEFTARYKAAIARFPQPDPQPHPEPIAWMVGTAFWWTKEEAERDAAAMGLPIVGLGPMSAIAPAEQHQGQPVGYRWEQLGGNGWCYGEKLPTIIIGSWQELYTHADPGEVERLRSERRRMDAALVACANRRDSQAAELDQCEAMAAMVAEREWAEHVGTGPVSSKIEAAFTQLHNDLHEAAKKLADRDALLHRWVGNFGHLGGCATPLRDETKAALSASAEPGGSQHKLAMDAACGAIEILRAQLAEARNLLDTASITLARWLNMSDEPRRQIIAFLEASAEPSAPVERDEREQCAICRDLGRQCMECEEAEFREWADRYFAATDYRKTDAGVFIRDWMRHAYAAWRARAALERKPS